MNYQRRGLSSTHSQRYNLRSHNSNIGTGNTQSTSVSIGMESVKITDYFFVRKRRSVSSGEESGKNGFQKHVKKRLLSGSDQMVPDLEQKENLQSELSRWLRFAIFGEHRTNPFGRFAAFNPQVFLTVIEHIPVAQLANLAQTSSHFNSVLRCYVTSGAAGKRFISEITAVEVDFRTTNKDPFYAWGLLLKSVTLRDSTSKRIDYFNFFYDKHRGQCDDSGWGRCILAFSAQWDFAECALLLHSLFETTENGLYRATLETLDESDGLHPHKEMRVRRRLRNLFLEPQHGDARNASFWLSAVLRMQSDMTKQAKLLYILFGPTQLDDCLEGETSGAVLGQITLAEIVDWRGLCDIPMSTFLSSRERLGPLADALFSLLQTKFLGSREYAYSEANVFTLIEELTTYPERWLFDNFIALLLNRTSLIPIALVFRVVHNYEEEAGQMFNIMKSLLCRWHMSVVSCLARPMHQTISPLKRFQRIALLRSILAAHLNATLEHLDHLPDRQQEFLEELQTAATANPLLRILGMMI